MNQLHSGKGTFSALPMIKNEESFIITSRKHGGKKIVVFDISTRAFRFLDKYTQLTEEDLEELLAFGKHIILSPQINQK